MPFVEFNTKTIDAVTVRGSGEANDRLRESDQFESLDKIALMLTKGCFLRPSDTCTEATMSPVLWHCRLTCSTEPGPERQ